jgi:hypothetical protein
MAVFEYQNQVIIKMIVFDRVDVVIVLVLAFGIQTKRRFGNTKNNSFFNMTLFEGGTRPDLALTVLIFLTAFALTVPIFHPERVLTVPIFFTELVFTD